MKLVSVTQVSNIGKAAIGLIVAVGGLLQIPSVGGPLTSFGHYHPHIATIAGTITLLTTFLTNPQVQKVFNIELPPDSKAKLEIKTPPDDSASK